MGISFVHEKLCTWDMYGRREYTTREFFISKGNAMGILKYACRDFIEKLIMVCGLGDRS